MGLKWEWVSIVTIVTISSSQSMEGEIWFSSMDISVDNLGQFDMQ